MPVRFEWRRLCTVKFLILLAFLLIINCLFMVRGEAYTPAAYRQICADIQAAQPEQMLETLTEQSRNLQVKYTDSIDAEIALLRQICGELQTLVTYPDYLAEIDTQAKKMQSVSLFAEQNAFAVRAAGETAARYAPLKEIKPVFVPEKAVQKSLGGWHTDVLIVILTAAAVLVLVSREQEQHLTALLRSTERGRASLGLAKLRVFAELTMLLTLLFYGSGLLTASLCWGSPDWHAPVQSIAALHGCPLAFAIWQYVLGFLAVKICTLCLIAGLLYTLAVLTNTAFGFLTAAALTAGIETVLYRICGATERLAFLHNCNLLHMLDTQNLLSGVVYRNVLGRPVSDLAVVLAVTLCLLTAAGIFCVLRYAGKSPVQPLRTKKAARIGIGRTVSVLRHELWRFCISGRAILLTAVFAVFYVWQYQPPMQRFSSMDEVYYRQYITAFAGEYNADKQAQIDCEAQRFSDLHARHDTAMANGEYWLLGEIEKQLAPEPAFEQVTEYAAYLAEHPGTAFVYDTGYRLLTGGDRSKELRTALCLLAILLLVCVPYFTADRKAGRERLLHSTDFGDGLHRRRRRIAAVYMALLTACVYLADMAAVLRVFGTAGIREAAASMPALAWAGSLPIGAVLVLFLAVRMVIAVGSVWMAVQICKY